jgi:hypothetical protein
MLYARKWGGSGIFRKHATIYGFICWNAHLADITRIETSMEDAPGLKMEAEREGDDRVGSVLSAGWLW